MIKESDWKQFKRLKKLALERFCAAALAECRRTIEQGDGSSHSRYLALYTTIQEAARVLASLFDDHSRSRAGLQLMLLRSKGLVADSELEPLSDDFRRATEPPSWED